MFAIKMEKRLVDFGIQTIYLLRRLKQDPLLVSLKAQLVRSATSTALNYAEARGANSKKDFSFKTRLVLKELRESYVTLKILKGISPNPDIFDPTLNECNELISIFVKATKTLDQQKY